LSESDNTLPDAIGQSSASKVERVVTVWVCPSCPNFYGSSNAGDLRLQWNHRINGQEKTFTRDRCPDCGDARVPCVFGIELEAANIEQELAQLPKPGTTS
jgi:Zn finger protein HypA/HybF involved in hydrogenase expression